MRVLSGVGRVTIEQDHKAAAEPPLECRVRHGATKGTEMDKTDSRYPYTYAADYLREKVGNDYDKGLMSRSAASQARSVIAGVLGLSDSEIAQKLADAFIAAHSA